MINQLDFHILSKLFPIFNIDAKLSLVRYLNIWHKLYENEKYKTNSLYYGYDVAHFDRRI